jgi:hypothetical protein
VYTAAASSCNIESNHETETQILRPFLDDIPRICAKGHENDSENADIQGDSWQCNRLPSSWLDSAHPTFSIANIEAVKYVLRLIPWLLMMVAFWAIYGQTKTAFQLQGCSMDPRMTSSF